MGTDIMLYVFLVVLLAVALIATLKVYWFIGPIVGLVGAIFTYQLWNSGELILHTFIDPTTGALVYDSVALGWYGWLPAILVVLCIAFGAKGKH